MGLSTPERPGSVSDSCLSPVPPSLLVPSHHDGLSGLLKCALMVFPGLNSREGMVSCGVLGQSLSSKQWAALLENLGFSRFYARLTVAIGSRLIAKRSHSVFLRLETPCNVVIKLHSMRAGVSFSLSLGSGLSLELAWAPGRCLRWCCRCLF